MTDSAATSVATGELKNSSAEDLAAQLEERLIHQEYKIWKKNTPFLYDYVMTHGLEWPSLTCEWLPTTRELNDGNKVGAVGGVSTNVSEQHEMLLGTHTTGEQNYLMIGTVNLPHSDAVIDNRSQQDDEEGEKKEDGPNKKQKTSNDGDDAIDATSTLASSYNEEKDELGGYTTVDRVGKIEIRMKIPHDGEVNRARFMPQNHFVVATRGPSPEVYIWDFSKHSSFPAEGATPSPQVVCRGHTGEGYGVAWCGVGEEGKGKLVTCAEDKTVRIWDVNQALKDGKNGSVVHPEATLEYHTDVVEDVDWHNLDPHMIGSCGDDKIICLWDTREDKRKKPIGIVENAHAKDVNSLEFHPSNEHLFASGGSDNVVKLWDIRNLKSPLQTLEGHTDQVYTVHWSPHDESVLASCAADRRVALWDLSRIGDEQSPEDAEDGPPELLFLHGGHTSKVSDFSWNTNYGWCLSSVSEDNVLQVWAPTEGIYADGEEFDDDEDEDDLATKQRTEILGDDELE